jgi:oligosaccharide repeat unit polymerase
MVFAGLVNMQRAGIVVCFLLAGFSFTLTPQTRKFALPRKQLATLVVSALFGFFLITSNRGIVVYLAGESAQLYKLGEISPTIPNLYFYLSGPPATLSSYLSRGSEPRFLGRMTFAPVYRAAAKLGFDTYVPYYQKFYPTPEDMNTATYLRDIHADYGLAGVMLFPPLLGFTVTFFSLRCNTGVKVVVLAHLLVLVTFTFSSSILITGYWYVSLITSSGAMLLAKRFVQTPVMPL